MQRILIIGNAGAGKSTFARALSLKFDLPLVHLDKLFWRGDWETVSRDEFDSLLQAALEKPQWIIDGNFSRTLPHRLTYCDTVFWLDMPTWLCLWGGFKRIVTNYGKVRPDMGGNCRERFDKQKPEFFKSILGYNKLHRKNYKALLAQQENVNVIIFRRRRDVKKYLQGLE